MLQANENQAIKGWIAKLSADDHLLVVESTEVVAQHVQKHGMRRLVSLDDDFTLLALTSSPTRHLRHQLEAALMGTEIGEREHVVGVEDTYYLHRVEVQTLGDHLGAYKDVGLMVLESLQNALVVVFRARGVEVETSHLGFG